MLNARTLKWLLIFLFAGLTGLKLSCQNSLQNFNFQGMVLNSAGKVVANKNISVKINIYLDSLKTTLVYGEQHSSVTNEFGLFTLIVGQGTYNGGLNSTVASIDWKSGSYYLNVLVDTAGSSGYIDIGITKLVSVPYAMYSSKTNKISNGLSVNDLSDADTAGIKPLFVLKWNNTSWVPSKDNFNDTVVYSYLLDHAIHSDTAMLATNAGTALSSDTAFFALNSGMSVHSSNSLSSNSADHSVYSDTTAYAISTSPAWSILGNSLSGSNSFLGTKDNKNLIFRTNNISRITVSSAGMGINNSSPQSSLHLISNESIIIQGAFGSSGPAAPSGQGARMVWNSSKAAFRAGYVNSNYWNVDSLGNYSFIAGYNNKASGNNTEGGNFSMAVGSNNTIAAGGSITFGNNNAITENNISSLGSSVAMGSNNTMSYKREVVLGQSNTVSAGSSTTIGKENTNSGNINGVLGYRCKALGNGCISMGYYANTSNKDGCFVFSDASSPAYTSSTVSNSFIVRASGGVVFFTDADTTMGVYLASGSGSWSSVSDRHKKENFSFVNNEDILLKIAGMKLKAWKYKTQRNAFHVGPMAQDMFEAFHLGESADAITMTDIDGVILSCIKALNKRVISVSGVYDQLDDIKNESVILSEELNEFQKRLSKLETGSLK